MQNSMVITHTNSRRYPTPRDLYQTRTGDETASLPATAPVLAPAACATSAVSHSYCLSCDAGGQMIIAEKAAVICQCSRRLIYRWVEEGSLHFRELPDVTVLVCGVTLAAKLEQLEGATGFLAS